MKRLGRNLDFGYPVEIDTQHKRRIAVVTEKILSEQVNIWNELRPKSLGENAKVIISNFLRKLPAHK